MESLCALKAIYASKHPQVHTKPAWRMACMGLNVEGKCVNAHCEAFNSRVRCQKGFGVFNAGEPLLCPMCQTRGTWPTRIGFIGCQWMIEGETQGETRGENPPKWRQSSCDEYQRFGLDASRKYLSLIVTTKTLPSNQVTDMDHDAETCALESLGTLNLSTPSKL